MDPRQVQATRVFTQSTPVHSIDTDRVAVICYGHLRSFLFCMPETLKWASQFGTVDIYIHTWDKLNYDSRFDRSLLSLEDLVRAVCAGYNLVSLAIDTQPENVSSAPANILHNPWYFMYYSMWVANSLKKKMENDLLQRYALCVKIRPDIFIHSKMSMVPLGGKEYFFTASGEKHSDIVAITKSRSMDLICSFLGQLTDETSQAETQARHYEFISNSLCLEIAPVSYGSDWYIARDELVLLT